jgi:L-2-amino-thiazoline-4-carboxylic acid hydrolase
MTIRAALYRQSILFLFDIGSTQVQTSVATQFGRGEMPLVLKDARRELELLTLQLPNTGGWRNPHTQFIIATALFLALYRVLKTRGQSTEEVGNLILEAVSRMYSSHLVRVMRLFGSIQRRLFGCQAARRLARISQQRKYPDDFVCMFVEGDGVNFDYGFDYVECGICKFLHRQNADELAPYMCRLDYPYAEAMGIRLMRTSTIAEGGKKCDFRYKENMT